MSNRFMNAERRVREMVSDGGARLQLAVFSGEDASVYPLPSTGKVTLGRAEDNDVRIDNRSVSRKHAVLHVGPPLCVEDLGGSNGTFVRDFRELRPGDTEHLRQISNQSLEIRVGDFINLGGAIVVVRLTPESSTGKTPGLEEAIVSQSESMKTLYEQARLAARGLISILILGETGVGKDVLARQIHAWSPRAGGPMLSLNCAALSETLLESELFGHEKGAFTGAVQARPGLFESANGGTVFLDEVGELTMSTQVKLLRFLENRQVTRVGARRAIDVDVRFIAATNRDLEKEASGGRFRQDLYFRLGGMVLTVPPLRERREEIGPLAETFVGIASGQIERQDVPRLSEQALGCLKRYAWPGNVRELRHVIERAVILCPGSIVLPEHLNQAVQGAVVEPEPESAEKSRFWDAVTPTQSADALSRLQLEMRALERQRIIAALDECSGNQTRAAEKLGISRRTLVTRLAEYELPRPRKKKD
jgi:DNA-binding NtrC family response regulator